MIREYKYENNIVFECSSEIYNIFIEYHLNNNTKEATLYNAGFNPEHMKLYLTIFSRSVHKLIKMGFEYFIELVTVDDWNKYLFIPVQNILIYSMFALFQNRPNRRSIFFIFGQKF